MIICEYFGIEELVPPSVFEARGHKAWELIDPRLVENLDSLRLQLDTPLTINNWQWYGSRQDSGLRLPTSEFWSQFSQHSFGRAADIICGIPAETIREKIRCKEIILPHPSTYELDVNWLHMDVRNSTDHVSFFHP